MKLLSHVVARLGNLREPDLNGNLVLVAKMLSILVLFSNFFGRYPDFYLSFASALEMESVPLPLSIIYKCAMYGLAVGILWGGHLRWKCMALGLLLGVGVFGSKLVYGYTFLYMACCMIMIGLCNKQTGSWPLRCQMGIVYLGSASDKLFTPHWRDGRFLVAWTNEWPDRLPHVTLDIGMSLGLEGVMAVSVILLEYFLIVGIFTKRLNRIAVLLGIGFHMMTVAWTGIFFGVFVATMSCCYVALFDMPEAIRISYHPKSGLGRFASRFLAPLNVGQPMTWVAEETQQSLSVEVAGVVTRGWFALRSLLLYSPVLHLLMILFMFSNKYWWVNFKVVLVYALLALFAIPAGKSKPA